TRQLGPARDDVKRCATLQCSYGYHDWRQRWHFPADHGLEGDDDMAGDDNRVNAGVGIGSMTADPLDDNVEPIDARHDRPLIHTDLPYQQTVPEVQAKCSVNSWMFQNTLLNHTLCTTRRKLLGWLKGKLHRPGKLSATVRQHPSHGQQDGGVAIVSTG